MTDFDLDDPLADLLSDDSNDSFFEEPKAPTKRPNLTKTPEKKSVSDLFGLEKNDPKKNTKSNENDWLGFAENNQQSKIDKGGPKSQINKPVAPTKKISFDDDDVLNNLGLDKVDILQKIDSSKKTSLIQSILGPTKNEDKNVSSFDDILKASQMTKKTDLPNQTTTKKQHETTYSSSMDQLKIGRRPRTQPASLMDPLGLFSNDTKPEELKKQTSVASSPIRKRGDTIASSGDAGGLSTEILFSASRDRESKTKSTPNLTEAPDWLTNESVIRKHESDSNLPRPQIELSRSDTPYEEERPKQNVQYKQLVVSNENLVLESILAQQKLSSSAIGFQNTAIAMQQQESQLLMALQLKKYEENLTEMQRKQNDVLVKQEQQFSALLERQFAKQQIMENNMRLQQERINNHIQMLISQPSVSDTPNSEIQELKKSNIEESAKLYEDMISTLKQRSHEEMFLLEESYKKQISTLEQTMESIESRLKSQIEDVLLQQKAKIQQMSQEHETEIKLHKQKIEEMSKQHTNEIKSIRENHDRVVEEIKYEYATMVENIKHTKQAEKLLFENSGEYSQKLDSNLKMLGVNTVELVQIREKLEKDSGILTMAREESFKAKEEEIKLMKLALERARDSAETERAQLFSLVRSLETKLAEQRQQSREESWALQQAVATLAARSAALDRESEFNKASIEYEREQLKALKENLLAQHEKITLQLTEEKLSLSAEKSRLETSIKLSQNYDSQKTKSEVDAAIQVAKDAAELTDRERERLQKLHCEVELLKRNLIDRERMLNMRERDLDVAVQNADDKTNDAERAITEARKSQAQYNQKLKSIQVQLATLSNREKKLAEDKISLSKERIALSSQLRLMKRCSLCAMDNVPRNEEDVGDEFSEPVEHDFPQIQMESDSDLFRLQLQISEENLTNNININRN